MIPSARILTNPVTLRRDRTANVRGTRVRDFAESPALASVQPMRNDRVSLYGMEAGTTLYTAFFRTDPQLRTNDQILWGSTTLVCLASANDQAGRGIVWAVDCKTINPSVR